MDTAQVIEGVLKPDGTLQLKDRLTLLPGPVRVTVEPLATPASPSDNLIGIMDTIRQAQTARGYAGRSLEEMQAEEAARKAERDEYEARWRAIHSQTPSPPDKANG